MRSARLAAAARRSGAGFALAAALLAPAPLLAQPTIDLTQPGPPSVADVAEGLLDAVVAISSRQHLANGGARVPEESPFRNLFGDNISPLDLVEALGSGFVLDPSGIIVTNNHVIDEADEIAVIFHDGSSLAATVIGIDPKTDLAVLRVSPPRPLTAVTFSTDAPRVGDWVMAIGNPFGLGGTVTLGILSARNRDINTGPYDDYLQTDAAINRGNSGGPLFDMQGHVIGVNTAIISNTGDSIGLAFAVPAEQASRIIDQLIELGHTRRGWIGVRIQEVTDGIAEGFGIAEAAGALIAGVTDGGPAARGGLQTGDVVVSFDGQRVTGMRDLPRIVAATDVGRVVDVVVLRREGETILNLEVGELTEALPDIPPEQSTAAVLPPGPLGAGMLGLSLAVLTPEVRRQNDISPMVDGVLVTAIADGSLASERRIDAGDVIVQVGYEAVATPEEIDALLRAQKELGLGTANLLLSGPDGSLRFEWISISG